MKPDSILIVEDSPIQAEKLRRLLVAEGYSVAVAKNGVEGLAKAKELRPALVISDIQMPEMDGYELCRRIKGDEEINDIPVILLTSLSDPEDIISGLTCGAENFVTKPYDDDFILSRIRYVLENRHFRAGARVETGIEMFFAGKRHFITSGRMQIMDLLISSFETALHNTRELEKRNLELSALYELSSVISLTINIEELFNKVVDLITGMNIFKVVHGACMFTTEGDSFHLGPHTAKPACFLPEDSTVKAGDCLCGLVLQTGEYVLSKNSAEDARHALQDPDMPPHGHFIVPLKVKNKVLGVLCLFVQTGFVIDDRNVKMLISIGNQIGMALENLRLYEETTFLAQHDPLTGLANRNLMNLFLEKVLAGAERNGTPFSAILLDIDFFKKYNDTYGHLAGDKLLAGIGKVLLKQVRKADLVARFGGEEFLVLLSGTGLETAAVLAERTRTAVQQETGVTVSLGVSVYQSEMKAEELINRADSALYQAKQKGRNRVVIWTSNME